MRVLPKLRYNCSYEVDRKGRSKQMRYNDVIPLIGARSRVQLHDAVGALDLRLSPAELALIETAIPEGAVAGDRYNTPQMALLDSER